MHKSLLFLTHFFFLVYYYYFAAPSAPPVNIAISAITPNSVLLVWEPPPIDQQNGIIQYYLVMVDPQIENGMIVTLTANTTQLLVTNLIQYYTYQVTIAAVTVPGAGPFSRVFTVVLPEAG